MPLDLVFGPVPSRRLGRSLGINNIPPKHCSYSCVYCQVGRTTRLTVERRRFNDPSTVVEAVIKRVEEVGRSHVDYVTFVPDGEPTLDACLGEEIKGLVEAGLRVAVITNSSLLHREDVRRDLSEAHLVSLKADAASERTFRVVNRPHPSLNLDLVTRGMRVFAEEYGGEIIVETMLVAGLNDSPGEIRALADLVASLNPAAAYIAVPTRPPAEAWVRPPSTERILEAYEAFRGVLGGRAKLLVRPEEGVFYASTVDEIEAIIKVHPLPLKRVEEIARERGLDPQRVIEELRRRGAEVVEYGGSTYVAKRPSGRRHER